MSDVRYRLPESLKDQLREVVLTRDNAEVFCLVKQLLEADSDNPDTHFWVSSTGAVMGSNEYDVAWSYELGESSANGLGDFDERDR